MAKVSLADFTPDLPPRPDPAPESETSPELHSATAEVRDLPLVEVAVNPLNARTEGDEDLEELAHLADTIAHRGVLQPIVVCGVEAFTAQYPDHAAALRDARWVALIGNRRVSASRLADADTIRAVVDLAALGSIDEVMLVENGTRRDLHPLREADAIGRLRDRDRLSIREIGRRIGRSHVHVQHRLNLLGLIPALRAPVEAGTLTVKRARELGTLPVAEQEAIAAAGPPWTGNPVTTRPRRGPELPTGDVEAAARAIRQAYSAEQLTELIRLLNAAS